MHHHPQNRERAINLSILSVSGPVSALQPYSPRNPKTRGFPHAARRVMGITPTGSRVGIVYGRNYDAALLEEMDRKGLVVRNITPLLPAPSSVLHLCSAS
ncbi:unnamed protein product [Leuciscus chuanchicus]